MRHLVTKGLRPCGRDWRNNHRVLPLIPRAADVIDARTRPPEHCVTLSRELVDSQYLRTGPGIAVAVPDWPLAANSGWRDALCVLIGHAPATVSGG